MTELPAEKICALCVISRKHLSDQSAGVRVHTHTHTAVVEQIKVPAGQRHQDNVQLFDNNAAPPCLCGPPCDSSAMGAMGTMGGWRTPHQLLVSVFPISPASLQRVEREKTKKPSNCWSLDVEKSCSSKTWSCFNSEHSTTHRSRPTGSRQAPLLL